MLDRLKSLMTRREGGAERSRLAAAALLVEAAQVDGALDPAERSHILTLLAGRFALDAAAAAELLAAAEAESSRAVQLFPFARAVVEAFSAEERTDLLQMLWEIAYTDGRLHDYEAALVRRIAGLLHVADRDNGTARKRAMTRLGVVDDPDA